GDLSSASVAVSETAVVTVVLAAGSLPASRDGGPPIEGIEDAEAAGALVFRAGPASQGDPVVTNGGRILNVTARGESVAAARARAYEACELITFRGMRYRRDIAAVSPFCPALRHRGRLGVRPRADAAGARRARGPRHRP